MSAVSGISHAFPDRVEVRGRDLTGDLMGRLSFTAYFHLLLTGEEPTEDQRFFLDLLLVAIAEHGMMPTNVAARMTLAADPGSLQGAVAAGILGCGPVLLGTAEECAQLLERGQERVVAGEDAAAVAAGLAAEIRAAGAFSAGLRPSGPQAAGPARRAHPRAGATSAVPPGRTSRSPSTSAARSPQAWGRPLTMNVSLPIAAVMLDLGFPAVGGQGRSRSSRAPPACSPTSPRSASARSACRWPRAAEEAVAYEPPGG